MILETLPPADWSAAWPYLLGAFVCGYALGAIPFGKIFTRWAGLGDIRDIGSGNIGATNVLRTGNKLAAVLTLLGDALKGLAAVLLAKWLAPQLGFGEWTLAGVALAAFVGHLYPVFHRFAGGKGVATAAGVLLGINPWLGLATLVTWVIVAFFFRYSSLAALVSALFAVFYYVLLFGMRPAALAITVMSALLVWRHRRNIANLLAGKEGRIGEKGTGTAPGKGRAGRRA